MSDAPGFTLFMREGVDPATAPGKPPLPPRGHRQWEEDGDRKSVV